ncbi:hypothetical protein GIB67_010478 [Kingdonia uniflora]|uniref:Uncharacterized protein n=1 Tax=Kingdonia uniflora TaxID=39325 RepID=A0A7J7MAT7_9MAGN|nr:hypothetical protein GIB67_010478 [Kingdonia uniflora]
MAVQTGILLISYSKELIDGEPIYVSSNCFPVKATKFEPAGHNFHSAALKLRGVCKEEEIDLEEQKSEKPEQAYTASSDSYSSKGKKKSGVSGSQQQDHYALLGLGHLRFLATEDQIKKSYRETALKHHPDKQASLLLAEETEAGKLAKKDEIENHFKAIQEAYEILTDPVKRRVYDSTDEFDDEVPTDCLPQDFFKVFGPAFMRNGRWSASQPVPSLGDDNTPIDDVDIFYDYWYSFKSWREFPHADDFDLEQAESRDHKRWMERQNAKLREKARKEEYARVRTLVDNAYKRDPRITKRKEEEKANKKKKKEAKFMARKLEEEEAARVAKEEQCRKEEEDKKAAEAASTQKKVKEKEKKLLRKERSRLRTLSTSIVSKHLLDLTEDDVETTCMSFNIDQLRGLCDELECKEGIEQAHILKDAKSAGNSYKGVNQDEKVPPKPEQNGSNGSIVANGKMKPDNPLKNYQKKEKPWVREEIELLRKAILKYPKGTSRRWEVVSDFIGTGRSVDEILKATKTVLLQKPDSAKAFDSFLEKRKTAPAIVSPLTTREESEGVVIQTENPEPKSSKPFDSNQKPASSNETQETPKSEVTSNGVSSMAEQDLWSTIQERALVQALKTFPKEANQRWERVAAAVPGKTVNQCKKKLTSLKENFRSKK